MYRDLGFVLSFLGCFSRFLGEKDLDLDLLVKDLEFDLTLRSGDRDRDLLDKGGVKDLDFDCNFLNFRSGELDRDLDFLDKGGVKDLDFDRNFLLLL